LVPFHTSVSTCDRTMWPQFDVADTDASGQISFDKFSRSSHVLSPALALLVADKRSHSGDASTADEMFEEDEPQEADSKLGYPCTSAHVARHRTARYGRMYVEHATSGVQYTVPGMQPPACDLHLCTACTSPMPQPVPSQCNTARCNRGQTQGNLLQLSTPVRFFSRCISVLVRWQWPKRPISLPADGLRTL
jgi:hypothetical protein